LLPTNSASPQSDNQQGRGVWASESGSERASIRSHKSLEDWVIYALAGEWGGLSSKLRGQKTEAERGSLGSRLVICGRSIRVSPLRSFRRLLGDPDPCRTISCL
jgi:hypothetical protein